jgi:hypothetical protein
MGRSAILAVAVLVSALAVGCGGDDAEERVLTSQQVSAAFERAGLPVEDFLDPETCDDDPFDLSEPDGSGVQIIDAGCTLPSITAQSGRPAPYSLFFPLDAREFYVAVYASADVAKQLEAAGAPVHSNYVTSPRDVLREANVLAVVQPADDALTEQIEEILGGL